MKRVDVARLDQLLLKQCHEMFSGKVIHDEEKKRQAQKKKGNEACYRRGQHGRTIPNTTMNDGEDSKRRVQFINQANSPNQAINIL